ncbi:phosphopantothenoylcysteine decarboxylase subunit VHS3-like isoform X2 [Dioscorea cayenensis subsp. rotundata]|uniref:Phosphopantothenoylcysteine decarboxylase subunit VHS3-like isoform X2 n=1 Tax=Dioscorea cayennensis subsp. rotundata TaxID=55577 RepID=A0AB40D6Q8_DIOCR|nr:phosphopantothenoylcysteine decarboxylase subunit VHS3-like isoform X2 [Dioscorea cayenensis subsp. rotundata]
MEDAKAAVNGVEYDVESDDDEPREIVNVKVDDGDEDEEEQDGSGDDEGEEEEDGSDDDEDEEDSDDDDDEEAASDEVDKGQILYLLFLFVFGDASSLRVHFAESCRMELSPSDKPGIQFKATQSCYTNHTIVGIVFYLL